MNPFLVTTGLGNSTGRPPCGDVAATPDDSSTTTRITQPVKA
jgi:hypothetical protein